MYGKLYVECSSGARVWSALGEPSGSLFDGRALKPSLVWLEDATRLLTLNHAGYPTAFSYTDAQDQLLLQTPEAPILL